MANRQPPARKASTEESIIESRSRVKVTDAPTAEIADCRLVCCVHQCAFQKHSKIGRLLFALRGVDVRER